tara:strand:+ start:232 stop:744 length:513 start_codon:yes stop_codon:yes gene_type:complete
LTPINSHDNPFFGDYMKLFLSTYEFKIDKKGRISLPSSYRIIIGKKSKQELILFKSFKYNSLVGCDYNHIDNISKRVEQLDIFSDDQDDFTTSIFSELNPVNLDSEGRFVIPEELKIYAKIHSEATFIGQGNSFQIWNPKDAKKRKEESRKRLIKEKKTLGKLIFKNKND